MDSPAAPVTVPKRRGPKPKYTDAERKALKAEKNRLWYQRNRERVIQETREKYYAAKAAGLPNQLTRYYERKENHQKDEIRTLKQLLAVNNIPVPEI